MALTTNSSSKVSNQYIPEDTVVIVGCGFSGIGAAILLKKQLGKDINIIIYEKQSGIGGTWWSAAKYPGAACDVPSHFYSFSFARNGYWSHHFSPQGEIQQYLETVANKYQIIPHIQFNTLVTDCVWNDSEQLWAVTTRPVVSDTNTLNILPLSNSTSTITKSRYLIVSNAPLCEPVYPNISGRQLFQGHQHHSARWPKDFDPTGKRIAVIGTGASSAQFVPVLSKSAKEVIVFQRTPAWVVPRMDFSYPRIIQYLFAFIPGLTWLYRCLLYIYHDVRYYGFVRKLPLISWLNTNLALLYLKFTVKNKEKRAILTPSYSLGCKRIILSDDFYPALDRSNVTLLGGGVKEITANGIIGQDNIERKVDAIVYATGFDIEASIKYTNIVGQNNKALMDEWANDGGAEAYLGMTIPSFPNLFLTMGPNTGLGHSSVISMIEAELVYIVNMIDHMRKNKITSATITKEACQKFNQTLQNDLKGTVWQNCRSWYNLQGTKNITMWPWTVSWYWYMCNSINWNHYKVIKSN